MSREVGLPAYSLPYFCLPGETSRPDTYAHGVGATFMARVLPSYERIWPPPYSWRDESRGYTLTEQVKCISGRARGNA